MTERTWKPLLSRTEIWTLLVIALILLYRFPARLLSPQLWAEDGTVFLLGQRELGIASLWTPYAGYLHLIPRTLALAIGAVTPLLYIPALYNWAALLGTLLVGLFILHSRIELPYKPLWALTLVFIPHPYEVYLTITNLQWFFAAALPLFLLQTPAPTRAGRIGEIIALLFLGLTGPFLILFSPLAAYRLWRDGLRSRANIAFGLVVLGTMFFQARCILTATPPGPAVQTPLHWLATSGPLLLAGLFFGKNLPHFLLGDNVAVTMRRWEDSNLLLPFVVFAGITILVGTVLILRGAWQLPRPQRTLGFALLLCIMVLIISVMRRGLQDQQPFGPFSNGSRYTFVPYLHLTWAFLLITQSPGIAANIGRFCLILVACSTLTSIGHTQDYRDGHWADYIHRYERGETVEAPFPPDGLSGMSWRIRLVPPKSSP